MTGLAKSAGKQPRGFKPGQSGNPAGRPKGAKSKAAQLLAELIERGAHEVVQAIVDDAKKGNVTSARFLIERVAPVPVDRPISFDLPATNTASDLIEAGAAILSAVAAGELTPSEGSAVMSLVDRQRALIETSDLETRLAALEARS